MSSFLLGSTRLSLLVLLLTLPVFPQSASWDRAMEQFQQKQWAEAASSFSAIEQASPGKTEALFYRAQALVAADQLKEAETAIEAYVTAHPASAEGVRELGYVRFRQHQPAASLDAYRQAEKLGSPTAADLTISAQDYLLMMDTIAAAQALEQALKLDRSYLEAVYQLGRVRYKQGRMEEAIACFQQVLSSDPSRTKAQENLGLSLERTGQMDAALAAYQQAVALDTAAPTHSEHPYLFLGSLLVKMGRSQEAMPVLQRGIAVNPQSGKLHAQLGKAYLNLKQVPDAQREMEQAVQLDPKDGASHYALGRLYTSLGKTELADQQFQAAKAQFDAEKARSNTMGMGREMELTPE